MPKGLSKSGRDSMLRKSDLLIGMTRVSIPFVGGFTNSSNASGGILAAGPGWTAYSTGATQADIMLATADGMQVSFAQNVQSSIGLTVQTNSTDATGTAAQSSQFSDQSAILASNTPVIATKVRLPSILANSKCFVGYLAPQFDSGTLFEERMAFTDNADSNCNTFVGVQFDNAGVVNFVTRVGTSNLEIETWNGTWSASDVKTVAVKINSEYKPEFWVDGELRHVGPAITTTTAMRPVVSGSTSNAAGDTFAIKALVVDVEV